jgi:hypothetical protein
MDRRILVVAGAEASRKLGVKADLPLMNERAAILISRSCSAEGAWTWSFGATWSTIMPSSATRVWIFELQPGRPSGRSRATRHAFTGSMSWAA